MIEITELTKRDPRCKLSIKDELGAVKLYVNGLPLSEVAKNLDVSIHCVQNILRAHSVQARTHGEGTRLLHKHLFVKPPNDFPCHLKDKFQKLIAVFLLTDGCIKKDNTIQLISIDDILQQYFLTLCKKEFNIAPTEDSFKKKNKETSLHSKDACIKLSELSPPYKKYPRNKSIKEYLSEPQPTLSFLKDENLELLIECVRIAMSTEGSVHVEFPRRTIYPRLEFACCHPPLVLEWQEIFRKVGLCPIITRSEITWSKIKGLRFSKLRDIKRFVEIGGFIDGVKISGKSKYFANLLTKNQFIRVLLKMKLDSFQFPLEFLLEQKRNFILNEVINCKLVEAV